MYMNIWDRSDAKSFVRQFEETHRAASQKPEGK